MKWTFAAMALGGVLLAGFSAHAEGDAEAAPISPGQIRHVPAMAETAEEASPKTAPRPPTVRSAAAKPDGTAATVKPMLPADYRPHGETGAAAKETGAKDAATKPTSKPAAGDKAKDTTAKKRIPLAPTEAELKREIALRNGGPDAPATDNRPTSEKLADKATSIPNQRREWPTTVNNTAGPTSKAGPGSAQDRKGTMIEATGPQQGVIRNRW